MSGVGGGEWNTLSYKEAPLKQEVNNSNQTQAIPETDKIH